MNDQRAFEREVETWIAAQASTSLPDQTLDDILTATGRKRPLPRWLALIKEPPMRISSNVAIGSPMVRVAAIMVATLLLALMVAGAGIAGSRLLAADGPIIVDQSDPDAIQTIGEAVATAEDGDTILVRPGTYDESIVLDKDVTIRGDGERDAVVVELSAEVPPGDWEGADPDLPTAFFIEASDAILENLTLRGEASRIVIQGGAPELRDLVLDGVGTVYQIDGIVSGLFIHDGSAALIADSAMIDTDVIIQGSFPTFLRNELAIGALLVTPREEEDELAQAASVAATEPVIQENTIDGSVKWGIAIWGGARPEVIDNTIVDAQTGIIVEDPGTAPTLRGNTISGSRSQGINVIKGAEPIIDGNELTDNNIGIQTSSSDASLVGNTVSGGIVGISISGGSPTLEANEIGGVDRGLVIGFGTTPTLEGNTVCGNATNLVVNERAEMPDTSGNEICEDAPTE